MLSSLICSEISLKIMDQNSRVLIFTMILGRLFCQGGPHTELMQTPTINCPKLNCNTLQQQNPSSQRRYQQIGTTERNPSREKAPVNRERNPSRGKAPVNREEEPKAA
jgi:hypothetical protein